MSYEERRQRLGFGPTPTKPLTALVTDRHVVAGIVLLLCCLAAAFALPRGLLGAGHARLPRDAFSLPAIDGLRRGDGRPVPGVSERDFVGQVTVVNVWAAWCPYCRGEHADLMRYARMKTVRLVGIDYRDDMGAARDYLTREGNPYDSVGFDPKGAFARQLGVRGVPTTFVIGRDGAVVARLTGGLDPERITRELLPAIETALRGPEPAG
jgi:cytochrome c biogenesis protein CcmG/thiol:disulfide interchange protein DsbE